MSPQQYADPTTNHASTGPRTEAGKARSSQNRLSHGLSSRKFMVVPQDRAEFDAFYSDMLADLAPQGASESQLAEAIIVDLWRMSRARHLENEIFVHGYTGAKEEFFAASETWAARGKEIALLSLYSQRIHRVLTRNQADFAAMQGARKSVEASQVESRLETKAADPAEFVCSSTSALSAAADRASSSHASRRSTAAATEAPEFVCSSVASPRCANSADPAAVPSQAAAAKHAPEFVCSSPVSPVSAAAAEASGAARAAAPPFPAPEAAWAA